jgi:Helix-turn-helix of insertion element transposase
MAHNGTPGSKLTPAQRRAISALLSERDNRSAAAKAKIGERTLYKWLADAQFKQALQDALSELDVQVSRRLAVAGEYSVAVLVDALTDKKTRVRAADLLLTHRRNTRELDEVEARLAALEGKNVD